MREDKYKDLNVPPGPPTAKGIFGEPEYSGFVYEYTELGNHDVPDNWPQPVAFNDSGDVPGPPVKYQTPKNPDDITAGYGFEDVFQEKEPIFFYHSDHLGSSSFMTDSSGKASQFVSYLLFGEIFIDEHTSDDYLTPYKFNGKELDSETGLFYYGARYYDAKESRWYGTDPLAEKYINLSPYNYCAVNPVNRIDPDGRDDYTLNKEIGDVKLITKNDDPDRILKINNKGEVKCKKNGEAKVAIDGIEHGILSDGMNFKTESNLFAVGGEGQPSAEGLRNLR